MKKDKLVEVSVTFQMRSSADHDLIMNKVKRGLISGLDSPPQYVISDVSSMNILSISSKDAEEPSIYVGDIVYHEDVFSGTKEVKVLEVQEEYMEVEGDFSGGVLKQKQRVTVPIKRVKIKP